MSKKKTVSKKKTSKKKAVSKKKAASNKKTASNKKSVSKKQAVSKKKAASKKQSVSNGPITNYALFCKYMDNILQQNISSQTGNTELSDVINQSPHGAFWDNMSYATFINPQTTVPNIGVGPIVTPGNAKTSLLVQILQGPAQGFDQMPADGPPYFTAAQLQPIIDWINAGCPN